ncbi:hypothetical protein M501DRAFT_1014244 [Patellaria atrata CBS 101060]|uniref:Guanine nucleotide-exchange factor SEC12 n=1 Tax=Patellaria atrata CBS 101060 TaxID=1346257 RepID=A0A9P4SH15_9PEZI|nr:hypothetical protein M501DRAFT_1014244 [Patellaria atrata CBS 101060]
MPAPSFTKTTLSYPLYAADFDPYGRGYLVVAGGGGEGRSGVGNKITLLDVSSRTEIKSAAEIELSRDEDSVTSLATLAAKDGLVVQAGINSSEKQLQAGKNEHFRSFLVSYPLKTKGSQGSEEKIQDGTIEFLGKTQLFASPPKSSKNETYQRVIRLSPAHLRTSGSKRIGGICTGLADKAEIVLFDATVSSPSSREVIQRLYPPEGEEAADLDIIETGQDEFAVAYCTDYSIHITRVQRKAGGKNAEARRVYETPYPDVFESKKRSKFRAVRFLSPDHLLLLSNLDKKTGAELSVLRLYPEGPCQITLRKRLGSHVKAAVGLDVCPLDPDSRTGVRQIAIAVAGQDISISVLTIDHYPSSSTVSKFKKYITLRDVHPLQMTRIVWSPFHRPITPSTSEIRRKPSPQYLRLASVSMGNTVVIDTFSLDPIDKNPDTRHTLSPNVSEHLHTAATVFVAAFVLLVCALLFQSYQDALALERGDTPSTRLNILPPSIRTALGGLKAPGERVLEARRADRVREALENAEHFVDVDVHAPPVAKVSHSLRDLVRHHMPHLHAHHKERREGTPQSDAKAVVLVPDEDPASEREVRPEVVDAEQAVKSGGARKWEELEKHEREVWRGRLVRAGEWVEGEMETVLKSIFFGEVGGAIGGVVGEMLGGG